MIRQVRATTQHISNFEAHRGSVTLIGQLQI